jgi:predicted deacetylase
LRTRSAEPRAPLAAIGLHDVSPATWPECERLLELVRSVRADAPVTLLVVPDMHRRAPIDASPGWREAVDRTLARGGEIALHGLWHLDDGGRSPTLRASLARRFLTAGEAEFAALDAPAARTRIERGLEMLRRCGWAPAGFVPPAWQISEAARSVLADFGFRYTTTLRAITALPTGGRLVAPCLAFSSRSGMRRALSLRWNARQLERLRERPALRIALHPIDARYAETVDGWRRILEAVLRDRVAVTKSELCSELVRSPDAIGPRSAH